MPSDDSADEESIIEVPIAFEAMWLQFRDSFVEKLRQYRRPLLPLSEIEIAERSRGLVEEAIHALSALGAEKAEEKVLFRVCATLLQELGEELGWSIYMRCCGLRQSSTQPPSSDPSSATVVKDQLAVARRRRVEAYIDEVFRITNRRITRKDIWKSARYGSPTEFQRWQRNDRRTTSAIDQRFTEIFAKKPHLK